MPRCGVPVAFMLLGRDTLFEVQVVQMWYFHHPYTAQEQRTGSRSGMPLLPEMSAAAGASERYAQCPFTLM